MSTEAEAMHNWMGEAKLTVYWIVSPVRQAPLGFGVTAWSLDDAFAIIRALDYGQYLPNDPLQLQVTTDIAFASLDAAHVAPNMGPMAVRGMWYPFVVLGVPRWAEA